MKERTELAAIDLFKLIFCFFVLFIHCHPSDDVSYLLANGVGRLAVPFYFAAAGYLLAQRLTRAKQAGEDAGTVLGRYLKRIGKLYLIWTVIYLPFTWTTLIVGRGFTFPRILLEYLRCFFFTGSFTQLWYLPALMTGAVLAVFLCRCIKPFPTFLVGTAFYLIGIFDESYAGLCPAFLKRFFDLYNLVFERARIGLFFGFCFVAMGFLLAEWAPRRKKKRTVFYAVASAFFTALVCIESFYLYKSGISFLNGEDRFGMYIFLLPATWCLLTFALSMEFKIPAEQAKELRKFSTLVYVSHQFMNGLFIVTITDWALKWQLGNTFVGLAVILITTVAFSLWVLHTEKKGGKIGQFFMKLH